LSSYQEPMGKHTLEWPYPVNYGKETEVSINAARRGAKVAVVDKASIYRSGSGGAGVDHWHCVNPYSNYTAEEAMERRGGGPFGSGGYFMGHIGYVVQKESWNALLDLEQMGMKIRDVDDEFVGAPFRDEETKLMFAYDYYNRKDCIRVQGANVKPIMYDELKRLGVELWEHIMVTSLLTEGGKPGGRVVGATGVNVRHSPCVSGYSTRNWWGLMSNTTTPISPAMATPWAGWPEPSLP